MKLTVKKYIFPEAIWFLIPTKTVTGLKWAISILYHYYVVVSHAAGHEKKIVSVVPREQKKRAVKKDKRGTGKRKKSQMPRNNEKIVRKYRKVEKSTKKRGMRRELWVWCPRNRKREQWKRINGAQEREKEPGAPMRSVNGIKKNTPQGMRRIFLAARPIAYLHHTVLDHIVVTKQFLYDSTLYYMEQRLLQCI